MPGEDDQAHVVGERNHDGRRDPTRVEGVVLDDGNGTRKPADEPAGSSSDVQDAVAAEIALPSGRSAKVLPASTLLVLRAARRVLWIAVCEPRP